MVKDALVMDLRRRWSTAKKVARRGVNVIPGINIPGPSAGGRSGRPGTPGHEHEDPSSAWRGEEASPIENDMEGIFSDDDDDIEPGEGLTRCELSSFLFLFLSELETDLLNR